MKISVLTISDTRNFDNDLSGQFIIEYLKKNNHTVLEYNIVKDLISGIVEVLENFVESGSEVIFTTGGTGIAERDVTPEATLQVIDKQVPGIAETIRSFSLTKTKHAMLSRNVAGIKNKCLIVNLPGSKKAVSEILPYIIESVEHAVELILGRETFH
jgi:molybdenum cofactor synthesis domain-containing protein